LGPDLVDVGAEAAAGPFEVAAVELSLRAAELASRPRSVSTSARPIALAMKWPSRRAPSTAIPVGLWATEGGQNVLVASYVVNPAGVEHARRLIESRQYVLASEWGAVQPKATEENAYLRSHTWEEYARWHLGLTEGARDATKGRYAFVFGDFRRLHRTGLIAVHYRAAEWRHKAIELAAHELLQELDTKTGLIA